MQEHPPQLIHQVDHLHGHRATVGDVQEGAHLLDEIECPSPGSAA
jgi:hypothetical protein